MIASKFKYFLVCLVLFFATLIKADPHLISYQDIGLFNYEICPVESLSSNPSNDSLKIHAYKLTYRTLDLENNSTVASGLVVVREDLVSTPFLLSFHHGTIISDISAPSKLTNLPTSEVICFYHVLDSILIMPDYLGYADSTGKHPFLHSNSEAQASYDMILASVEFLKEKGISHKADLALTGYSQGGHVTVALQRKIEKQEDPEWPLDLKLSVPMAGPYALSSVGIDSALQSKNSKLTSMYVAFLIDSADHYYKVFEPTPPIKPAFQKFMDNLQGRNALLAYLYAPSSVTEMLEEDFIDQIRNKENTLFFKYLKQNDLDQEILQTETHLIASYGDEVVSHEHSEALLRSQPLSQNKVTLHYLSGNHSHTDAKGPSFKLGIQLIQSRL